MDDALIAVTAIVFQCSLNAARQPFTVKRLVQKADGASSKRLRADVVVGVGRDEDDWYFIPSCVQNVVQLDSTHVRHLDV